MYKWLPNSVNLPLNCAKFYSFTIYIQFLSYVTLNSETRVLSYKTYKTCFVSRQVLKLNTRAIAHLSIRYQFKTSSVCDKAHLFHLWNHFIQSCINYLYFNAYPSEFEIKTHVFGFWDHFENDNINPFIYNIRISVPLTHWGINP